MTTGREPTSDGTFSTAHALRPLAALLVGVTLLRTSADPDLWGHLRYGLDLLAVGHLTSTDPYSFTQDIPWVNHEWLSELGMAVAYTAGGAQGLLLLKWGLLGTTFAVLRLHLSSTTRPWRHGLLALAAIGLLPLATIRPQLWTILLITLLWRALSAGRIARWATPLLFVVWANAHGGWILGLGLLGTLLVGRVATRRTSPLEGAGLLAASVGATLLNPYGAGLWHFVATTVRLDRTDITEWQPLWRSSPEYALLWVGATAAACLAWRVAPDRRGLRWALLPVAMLASSSALVNRLVPLYTLVTAFAVAPRLDVAPIVEDLRRTTVDAVIVTVALALAVGPRALSCIDVRRDAETHIAGRVVLPSLMAKAPAGRAITYFDWGQQALFHLGPALKVSIDGRRETVYSPQTLQEQYAIARGTPDGLAALARLRPEYVWLPLPFSTATRDWLASNGYRIDVEDATEFLAVRADLPAMPSQPPLAEKSCFPGV